MLLFQFKLSQMRFFFLLVDNNLDNGCFDDGHVKCFALTYAFLCEVCTNRKRISQLGQSTKVTFKDERKNIYLFPQKKRERKTTVQGCDEITKKN